MRYHFKTQICAFHHAFKNAKTTNQKLLMFEKFKRAKETKEVKFLGDIYSWNPIMLEHKKHEYPAIAQLPIQPNLNLIRSFLEEHQDKWQDNYAAHEGLCVSNGKLADTSYGYVDHITLTAPNFLAEEAPTTNMFENFSARNKIRKENIHPYMDEYNWSTPLDFYKDSYLHKHLNSLFKSPIIRVRISRSQPGFELPPHIDYNTTYAVRFIIPIKGNKGVINKFWYKGEEIEYEMEEGKAYFLNVGYKHAVYHNGNEPRYYLLGTLGGQEDIECLRLTNTIGQ